MAIIAISQQIGSRGNDLGHLVAKRLGYRFLSREDLIAQVSRVYKVTAEQLVVLDERQPHFWSRLKTESARFVSFFRANLLREMAQDRLVAVSQTAAVFMPPYGCGIKVRVVGPFDDRVKLAGETENLPTVAAQRRVRDHDREVRARIQTLMGVDIDDPASYDIVVNGYGAPLEICAVGLAACAEQIDAASAPNNGSRCATRRPPRRCVPPATRIPSSATRRSRSCASRASCRCTVPGWCRRGTNSPTRSRARSRACARWLWKPTSRRSPSDPTKPVPTMRAPR